MSSDMICKNNTNEQNTSAKWPKDTVGIAGISIISGIREDQLTINTK